MSHDYRALGLKAGLEIHQQLNTKEKLFCGCPTLLRDTKDSNFEFFRYLRPTQSEMGVVDRAALEEVKVTKKFIYKAYDTTCLVENDEEPPRELNSEAIDLTLTIGRMLNMNILNEFHTMRKIVIDGSNTSGFQRTVLAATDGYLESKEGRVGVDVLCLEEEAAQKVEDKGDSVIYSLDRLGIPLVEIGTAPDIVSPQHAREVAELIGMFLRSTGKVKRGLGTIRQDINVSIAEGARVEVKGVQALDLIETIVEREAARQVALLEIKKELNERKASVSDNIVDVSQLFSNSGSKVIKKAIDKKGIVLAVNLSGFAGLVGTEIQPGRRLGTEFSDRAKKSGVGGIFHTDELPNYGITEDEITSLRDAVGAKDGDCVVMVADAKKKAYGALEAVIVRAREAMEIVPEETRRALPDGNSAYMRPLPGAARMYPETDVPPVLIKQDRIDGIELPELIDERVARYKKDMGLNEELANQIVKSGKSHFLKSYESPTIQNMIKLGNSPTIATWTNIAKSSSFLNMMNTVNSPSFLNMMSTVKSPSVQNVIKTVKSPSVQNIVNTVNSPLMQNIILAKNSQLFKKMNYEIFEDIMQNVPEANATLTVRTLETILSELEKEDIPIANITMEHLIKFFRLHSDGKIPNEAISDILKMIAFEPELTVEDALLSINVGVETGELESVIDRIIEERMDFIKEKGMNSVGPLMGVVMKDLRGKVSGKEISRVLKEKISAIIG